MLLLANEFDVRSVLREQVNLAAVNHIYVDRDVMNRCKNLKIHCFENVNIALYRILRVAIVTKALRKFNYISEALSNRPVVYVFLIILF